MCVRVFGWLVGWLFGWLINLNALKTWNLLSRTIKNFAVFCLYRPFVLFFFQFPISFVELRWSLRGFIIENVFTTWTSCDQSHSINDFKRKCKPRRNSTFCLSCPSGAWSWKPPTVAQVAAADGARAVECHSCAFRERVIGRVGHSKLLKKPTGCMTNSQCLPDASSRRCSNERCGHSEAQKLVG